MIQLKDETGIDYVITGKSLVITGPRQLVPVRMMNLSDCEKRLCANSYLADCEDVELITGCQADISTSSHDQNKMNNFELNKLLTSVRNSTSPREFTRAKQLLEEFQDIFSSGDGDCGRTTLVQHRIDTGSAKPIRQHPRSLPLAKAQESSSIIDEMHKNGVIEPSNSPWSSPVVLVKKKDASITDW